MGYVNHSMSERAVEAYEHGEKPYSKWAKRDILDELESLGVDVSGLAKWSADVLRRHFLTYASWHHTGKLYNETTFYQVDDAADVSERALAATAMLVEEERRERLDDKRQTVKARIRYGEWEGTRRHPKLVEHDAYAVIRAGWAWLEDGSKKSLNGKHVAVLERYRRAPKGTAAVFKTIMGNMKG